MFGYRLRVSGIGFFDAIAARQPMCKSMVRTREFFDLRCCSVQHGIIIVIHALPRNLEGGERLVITAQDVLQMHKGQEPLKINTTISQVMLKDLTDLPIAQQILNEYPAPAIE